MNVQDAHRRAMAAYDEGFVMEQRNGPSAAVTAFMVTAYALERQAAELLRDGGAAAEPSRAILYRSAAVLALKCGYCHEARRLATEGLRGQPPRRERAELRLVRLRAWRRCAGVDKPSQV